MSGTATVASWLSACCEIDHSQATPAAALLSAYLEWCESEDRVPETSDPGRFAKLLRAKYQVTSTARHVEGSRARCYPVVVVGRGSISKSLTGPPRSNVVDMSGEPVEATVADTEVDRATRGIPQVLQPPAVAVVGEHGVAAWVSIVRSGIRGLYGATSWSPDDLQLLSGLCYSWHEFLVASRDVVSRTSTITCNGREQRNPNSVVAAEALKRILTIVRELDLQFPAADPISSLMRDAS